MFLQYNLCYFSQDNKGLVRYVGIDICTKLQGSTLSKNSINTCQMSKLTLLTMHEKF